MRSFYSLQKKANARYYKRKGSAIYQDFSTFAQTGALSQANAIDFHNHVRKLEQARGKQGELRVCEFGVGDGSFCKGFLEWVKLLDAKKKTDYLPRIRYSLFDISAKMLSASRKNLSKFKENAEFVRADAAKDIPFNEKAHYVRINELYTDLPARVFTLESRELREVFFEEGKGGLKTELRKARSTGEEKLALLFLSSLPEGYFIPFNVGAAAHVIRLRKICDRSISSYADIFDYGFDSLEAIAGMPREMWNAAIVRDFGGQLTTDLNLPFLSAFAKSVGFSVKAEPQKDYVERILGKSLSARETRAGLAYAESKSAFKETDDFFHLRLSV